MCHQGDGWSAAGSCSVRCPRQDSPERKGPGCRAVSLKLESLEGNATQASQFLCLCFEHRRKIAAAFWQCRFVGTKGLERIGPVQPRPAGGQSRVRSDRKNTRSSRVTRPVGPRSITGRYSSCRLMMCQSPPSPSPQIYSRCGQLGQLGERGLRESPQCRRFCLHFWMILMESIPR